MTRVEVLTGPERRRRWSDDEKAAVLAELAKPGASGAAVARRFGVNRGLIYKWRREAGLPSGHREVPSMPFAPVMLSEPARTPSLDGAAAAAPETPMIEIEVKGARVRLPTCVSAAMVAATIRALRGRS
ncbi:MAG: IS66-like element accessory protein TnpA [Rhodospirillales bacterium]|jgi:transposase